jgi:cephalosporin-C deacetylase
MISDIPVSELTSWRGRNPCPPNYDAYWERALAELDSIDPKPELIPAEFKCNFAECFDLFYSGVRGAKIHAKYIRPKSSTSPVPALLSFHGYGMNSGDWYKLLPYAAAGMAIAAMDCRGQGGLSEDTGSITGNTLHGQIIRGLDDTPDNLLLRHIFLDTAQLVRTLSSFKEIDGNRLGAFGGSQGGGLTIACAALSPQIKRIAPFLPFLCDYKRVWELEMAKDAYLEIKEYFRLFDPRHEREDDIFNTLGYIDVQFLAPRIKAEVLFFTALMDTICPPSSQFAAYNKITSKKKVLLYPDFGHEPLPDYDDITFEFFSDI